MGDEVTLPRFECKALRDESEEMQPVREVKEKSKVTQAFEEFAPST